MSYEDNSPRTMMPHSGARRISGNRHNINYRCNYQGDYTVQHDGAGGSIPPAVKAKLRFSSASSNLAIPT
jgi:hypothetical protein